MAMVDEDLLGFTQVVSHRSLDGKDTNRVSSSELMSTFHCHTVFKAVW
jgi:hypothetical protein